MAISSKGIRTPDDTTLFDPPVDMAAMATSIDPLINFRRGTASQMAAASAQEGEKWFNTTDKREYVRKGTAWQIVPVIPVMATGVATLTGAANVTRTITVSFPPGLFTGTPNIQLTPLTSAPQNLQGVSFNGASESSVNIWVRYATTTDVPVHWTATEV